jgi:hypothetical protein
MSNKGKWDSWCAVGLAIAVSMVGLSGIWTRNMVWIIGFIGGIITGILYACAILSNPHSNP